MKRPKPSDAPPATLGQLQELCARPVRVEIYVRNEPVVVTGRRMRAREIERWQELVRSALPPTKAVDGKPEPDLADSEYRARVRQATAQARACALFTCYPIFSEQAPPAVDRSDPAAQARWLDDESGLEPSLLEALYDAVVADVVRVPDDRVGFI